jgi:hypothetical protein
MPDKKGSSILQAASHQTSVRPDALLTSVNSGVTVHRVGTIKAEFRSEARIFARELAEYINTTKGGIASAFVFEETFGTKDVIHWLLHINDLGAYETMVRMGSADPAFRDIILKQRIAEEKGGGTWDRMFVDGSIQETVLLPQFYGMYGTTMENEGGMASETRAPERALPLASSQTDSREAIALNTATSGIVLVRSAKARNRFRGEARQFGRAVAASLNDALPGQVSSFLFEEAFGSADRIHWIIHMKNLEAYYSLINLHAAMIPEIVDIYTREWIAPEKGGGNWSRIFMDGTFADLALTPQNWNMYATQGKQ